jgi:hypothetical protein
MFQINRNERNERNKVEKNAAKPYLLAYLSMLDLPMV